MKHKGKKIDILYDVVDARYSSEEEQKAEASLLMEARKKRIANRSQSDIFKARLMQLKLQMEEFLNTPAYDKKHYFTSFLETYIDTLYDKRSAFADDIGITPVSLSQVLNNHREPKEEFMLKLMVHSERAFKSLGNFHKKMWYQVYFQEKINETIANQEKWRPEVEKKVKFISLI
ncbi:hypothetical protein [Olivibacter sp. XZL3]|uniref:hypothetical protein n=1 Tax=Olivibacter sp. XZL3 TaxID=1735116 RepID=UPI0010663BFE|nr:hypothetical protein [Olivibacter sp. XZL3]